ARPVSNVMAHERRPTMFRGASDFAVASSYFGFAASTAAVAVLPPMSLRYDVSRISSVGGYDGMSSGYCCTATSPNFVYVALKRFDDPGVMPKRSRLSARLFTYEPPRETSVPALSRSSTGLKYFSQYSPFSSA